MRSQLARMVPHEPADDDHLEAMRRAAWIQQGIITVRPEDVRETGLRMMLEGYAIARWGRRSSASG